MTQTRQPIWKCINNLGDVNPLEYGGYFVFIDTTGVYPPEAELIEVPDARRECKECDGFGEIADHDIERGEGVDSDAYVQCTKCAGTGYDDTHEDHTVYRFILDQCTCINGVLSDNRFHPEHLAWFARDIERISDADLTTLLCSADPNERADAYREIGLYHGFENFDSYPVKLTRIETEARIAGYMADLEVSK